MSGGVVYDLYANATTNLWLTGDVYITKKFIASVDYDYFQPTYDADSIWNFFATYPMNDIGARRPLRRDAEALVRRSAGTCARSKTRRTETTAARRASSTGATRSFPAFSSTRSTGGATASARFRRKDTLLAVNGSANFGDQGDRAGGDVSRRAHLRHALRADGSRRRLAVGGQAASGSLRRLRSARCSAAGIASFTTRKWASSGRTTSTVSSAGVCA